ncbi:MAG: hypothetical protein U0573_03105 [Phycisphaerales bacterium]|nr:hypothetical protein [Planctomycetota bacterium]
MKRAIVLSACALAAPVAFGQAVLTSDQRGLVIEAAGVVQTKLPAPAFSAFIGDIQKDVPQGGGNAKARATQTSSVSGAALSASGLATAESNAGPSNCLLAQSTSDFRVTFKVNGPVQYDASGSVEGAQYRLADPISGAINIVIADMGDPKPFTFSTVLRPGRNYTVLAQSSQLANSCNGSSASISGIYSLNATFTALPACPADLNYDRLVDDADFSIFAVAYDQLLCPTPPIPCDADLNSDGFVDDADFSIFAVAYDQLLCP